MVQREAPFPKMFTNNLNAAVPSPREKSDGIKLLRLQVSRRFQPASPRHSSTARKSATETSQVEEVDVFTFLIMSSFLFSDNIVLKKSFSFKRFLQTVNIITQPQQLA